MSEKRKMPVRTREITLKDEWEGWTFTARTNPPIRVIEEIISGDIGRMTTALGEVVMSWNFVDEEGNDYFELDKDGKRLFTPKKHIHELPTELVTAMVVTYGEEVGKNPPA